MTIAPSRAAVLDLVAGVLCLDFVNTASGRGTDARLEHLQSYETLVQWSVHVGALDPATARALASMAKSAAARDVFARAIVLREAIARIVVAIIGSTGLPADAATIVGAEAAAAIQHSKLTKTDAGVAWSWPARPATVARPLWPVAQSAYELMKTTDPARLKQCPAADCGWLFLDRSKNNSRRWCDMRTCGNRRKAREHYRRHHGARS